MILKLLSAACAVLPGAYGTPLLPGTVPSPHDLHRRQEIVPTNPHAGQPYCAADTQNKGNCNDGDTIIEINANDPLPPPPKDQKPTDSFTDLVTSINQGNLTGPSQPACKIETTGQNSNCRPQSTIDDYTLDLDPDPTSKLSLTLDFSAAKDACPFARLPDYEFLSGDRRDTKANATLYEIGEDVAAADEAGFLARMDDEVDKLVADLEWSFQDSWGVGVYDYAGINGTSLDMRTGNKKDRRSIGPRYLVPANNPNNANNANNLNAAILNAVLQNRRNLAAAAHRLGDIRMFFMGAAPLFLSTLAFNHFTQPSRPRAADQPDTFTPAFQAAALIVIGLIGGILLQNIRNRWGGQGRDVIRPAQRLLLVIAVKVLAFLADAARRGGEWLAAARRPRVARRAPATLPSDEEMERAIGAVLGGGASTSGPPQLELPQKKLAYQPAEIALERLSTLQDQMKVWHDSFQNSCQIARTAIEGAQAAGKDPN